MTAKRYIRKHCDESFLKNLLIFILKIFGYGGFSLLHMGSSLAVVSRGCSLVLVLGLLITLASLVAEHGP